MRPGPDPKPQGEEPAEPPGHGPSPGPGYYLVRWLRPPGGKLTGTITWCEPSRARGLFSAGFVEIIRVESPSGT
jgi:hypothetical protein